MRRSVPTTLALCFLPSAVHHLDVGGPLHHVGIGQRDPGGIHHHARAQAPLLLLPLGDVAEEAAEELVPEELLDGGAGATAAHDGVDVDDGGPHRLHDLGEAARGQGEGGRDDARPPRRDRRWGGWGRASPPGRGSRTSRPPRPAPSRGESRTSTVLRRIEIIEIPPRPRPAVPAAGRPRWFHAASAPRRPPPARSSWWS